VLTIVRKMNWRLGNMIKITTGLYNEKTGRHEPSPMLPTNQTEETINLDYARRKAERLVEVELTLEELVKSEKLLKEEQRLLRLEQIPAACFELGIPAINAGNRVVVIEPLITAALPSKDEEDPEYNKNMKEREEIFNWLVDKQEGGNIIRELIIRLPKGDAITEHRIKDALKTLDLNVEMEEITTIHHKTYTALCKRLVEKSISTGEMLPLEKLHIWIGNIARVK
jgi:hypothetical protein